jgi:putative ABC transport system permease protein
LQYGTAFENKSVKLDIMLQNYLKIALRNLQRNATYSFINIAGLAIGITCSILILLWVIDEVTYNKFLPKYNQLHQVWIHGHMDGTIRTFQSVPQPTADALKELHPGIKQTAIIDWGGDHLLTIDHKKINKRGYYVTEAFLSMFEFPLLEGDAKTALADPKSIVITKRVAEEIFGDEDAMNKYIQVDNAGELKVTGILENIPNNSSLEFDILMTWEYHKQEVSWIKNSATNWNENSFQVYAEITPDASLDEINKAIFNLINDNTEPGFRRDIFLYPMSRWRLHSNFTDGIETGGSYIYVSIFTIIAIIILIIACVNFMNLATARSERRAKEVGIRKTVGSDRKQIINQFLGESILTTLLAFIISLIMVELTLPLYNTLVQKKLVIHYSEPSFWIISILIILVTGLLAGSYPAFYLSSFQPAKVLKGASTNKGKSTLRQILVTIQFIITIVFFIGAFVFREQIEHIKMRSTGYDQENLIYLSGTKELNESYDVYKNELLANNVASAVTRSQAPITTIMSNNFLSWPEQPQNQNVMFNTLRVDYDFIKTVGVKLQHGREFSEDFKNDTSSVIINQTALNMMGYEDPIGRPVTIWERTYTIVGVIDDMLMGSAHSKVAPMFMVYAPWASNYITIRLKKTNDLSATLKKVEEITQKYNEAYPFSSTFVDENYSKKFESINFLSSLSNIFSALAIIISCLGLFGLAAFTAEQRTKEIGIRKALGASIGSIIAMISWDFSKLVLLAFLIAAPLGWYFLDLQLESYEYRISIPIWTIIISGLITFLISLFIVSYQAFRAGKVNPVTSLRTE